MRLRRFLWVSVRAGLLFGVLLGVIGGGLTASLLHFLLPKFGIHPWPPSLLFPAIFFGSALMCGLLFAAADFLITRHTPLDRLDPGGAVRQSVTIEVPVSVDAALEGVSRLAFEEWGWPIEKREEGHLTLRAPASFRSLGEQVTVDLHPTPDGSAALIGSRPLSAVIVVDYNKNRENVLRIREWMKEELREPKRRG